MNAKLSEKPTFYSPSLLILTRTYEYQGVRNVNFSENSAYAPHE